MRKTLLLLTMVAISVVIVNSASAKLAFEFSVDLGSDLDVSDPFMNGNEWMDCGDVYEEAMPMRQKDDSFSLFPNDGDGDGDGPNMGYPYQNAVQPLPNMIGSGGGAVPGQVFEMYYEYFDLDGDDQLCFELPEQFEQVVIAPKDHCRRCIAFEPRALFLSFDDDGAPGWYNTPDVPTMAPLNRKEEVFRDRGQFAQWSPPTLRVSRTETMLGLGPDPSPDNRMEDDDVDALDLRAPIEEAPFWYWSPDHEAFHGDDPGGVYMTVMTAAGVNKRKVLDDTLNFGVPQDTDIDAFEFVTVDMETYYDLFREDPIGATPEDLIVCVLFSVDEDDPDTDASVLNDFVGDESGGLMPNVVYISNMLGRFVQASDPYEEGDIDALTTGRSAKIPGDANFDDVVNDIDLGIMAANWLKEGEWEDGDFDGDGFVGPIDASILAAQYNSTTSEASGTTAVPEPSAIMLLVSAVVGLLYRGGGRKR